MMLSWRTAVTSFLPSDTFETSRQPSLHLHRDFYDDHNQCRCATATVYKILFDGFGSDG